MFDTYQENIDKLLLINQDGYLHIYSDYFNNLFQNQEFIIKINDQEFIKPELLIDSFGNFYYKYLLEDNEFYDITITKNENDTLLIQSKCVLNDIDLCNQVTDFSKENDDYKYFLYYIAITQTCCSCDCSKKKELFDELKKVLDLKCKSC